MLDKPEVISCKVFLSSDEASKRCSLSACVSYCYKIVYGLSLALKREGLQFDLTDIPSSLN